MTATQLCLLAAAILGQGAPSAADDPAQERTDASAAAVAEFQRDAENYRITLAAAPPVALLLAPQPLLRWGNPARNGEDGVLYAWLRDGRPEVVGSVFTLLARQTGQLRRKHTFHSLSDSPLSAEFNSTLIWSPKRPGVTFAPVAGADAPGESAPRRLAQMRELARQVSMEMVDLRGQRFQLRLMAQPLIRYQPTAGPVVDGAIFAFAEGTDPEALLLVEARRSEGRLRWECGFARQHFVELTARRGDEQVWRVAADPDMHRTVFGNDPIQREKVYYSVYKP
jgi:hypothetical protein